MNLLAIDASTEACSVAIQFNNEIFSEFELCPQSHSLVLLPMVDRLLQKADCQLSDFDVLIYGRGPGSFTGVRIGIGVAQGLAYSADLPTVGVSTMQAMAQQAFEEQGEENIVVAIDARMSEVYTAMFAASGRLTQFSLEEKVIAPESFCTLYEKQHVKQCVGVGTGWEAYADLLSNQKKNEDVSILYPNAKYMLSIGEQAFINGEALPAEQAQPVYVRDTVSWKKLPGR